MNKSYNMQIKDIQKRNRERKAELIKKAQDNGVIDKAVKLLSAMYLLHCHSAVVFSDLEDLLQENGLELGGIKWNGKKLNESFDKYFSSVSKMIGKDQVQNWADDLENFGKMFNEFAGIKDGR